MTRFVRAGVATTFALAMFSMLCPSTPLAAQELAEGTWTGTITTPDGEWPVEYEVEGKGDELSVTMVAVTGERMPFDTAHLADGVLHLAFTLPDVSVECELAGADDGGYEGECSGSDGNGGTMKMIPPAAG